MAEHGRSIEVELRYKVHNVPATIAALAKAGITETHRTHLIDQWFAPTHVRSMADEEQWFDVQHGIAWRLRRTEQADGSFTAIMDSKQLTSANNHDTFHETAPVTVDYDTAVRELADKNYRCWLNIDKTRHHFAGTDPHLEIVLDEIANVAKQIGVGAGLEIEFKGEGNRLEALDQLAAFARTLGLNESERFERSFTVEAMQALADFTS